MKLSDLLGFEKITIQCHDNPDPDAIASGYSLYLYYKSKGKQVRLIYSGRDPVTKSNVLLMIAELHIPIVYEEKALISEDELLITVDCQYGERNVTKLEAKNVAVIDHHRSAVLSVEDSKMMEIHSEYGSCSTLCWKMLCAEGYPVDDDIVLCTALYYGLMTDTGDFVELNHPVDKDMRDILKYNSSQITNFSNSKISLEELEIAGVALLKYIYSKEYRYALIHAKPCDTNVLGYISDLVLQVDVVDTCVVFNDKPGGYKYSVRSCIKDVRSNEFAAYLSQDIGGGGGHKVKAGGFISASSLEDKYPGNTIDTYMSMRLDSYFSSSEIIDTDSYEIDTSDMKLFVKKPIELGFVEPLDIVEAGDDIFVRTLEGDVSLHVTGDFYIMIGVKGEVYPIKKDRFSRDYTRLADSYELMTEYLPSLRSISTDKTYSDITKYASSCRAHGGAKILAKPLDHICKIYTAWDKENYYLGNPGDYIACKENDTKDVYIIAKDIFELTYEKVSE